MIRKIGNKHAGFELLDVEEIHEISSIAYTWSHIETKLKLLYLSNKDDNKVFLIGFRTPPGDSTGAPHILEHSVLCGSAKFPLKDLIMELIRGSMTTFVNAMTSPDNTIYPVASQNSQDFQNLMDVYMDAVLHPLVKQEKKIFEQEGWHYEILRKEDPITIQGIVYNEMKGAYSSPEEILDSQVLPSLYPHTPYRYDSGGDPDYIPALTYKNFITFHDRYYHPSNGFIMLYGDGNMEEQLTFLQEKYLKYYSFQCVDSSLPLEPLFSERKTVEFFYPTQERENLSEKTYFSLNFALPPIVDPETHIAWGVLAYILLRSSAAPLKKALLDAGLGKDIYGSINKSLRQPVFSIVSKHASLQDKDKFTNVIEETLTHFAKEGIDKKLVESSLNYYEFQLREADFNNYPRGVAYAELMVMNSCFYNLKPTLHLAYQPALDSLRKAIKAPVLERLIQNHLLQNSHSALLIGKPDPALSRKKTSQLTKEMETLKNNLSGQDLHKLIQESIDLKKYQAEEDTDEIKKKIPQLSLQDIRQDAMWYPESKEKNQHVLYLTHPIETNDIAYLKILFPASGLKLYQLPYMSLMKNLLGEIDTKKHTYDRLSQEIDRVTGGMKFKTDVITQVEDDMLFTPYFTMQTKFFFRNTDSALSLVDEIISSTIWNQPKRIRELLQQFCSRFEMNIFDWGDYFTKKRVAQNFSPAGYIQEQLEGISYYQWAKDWLSRFDRDFDQLTQELEKVRVLLLSQVDRVVSITAEPIQIPSLNKKIQTLNQPWQATHTAKENWQIPLAPVQEGIQSGAQVQFVVQGNNFRHKGIPYHGSYKVIENLLSNDYLWNKIRVQGGAYGGSSEIDRNGNLFFLSYRDPHLKETFEVYKEASAYLENYQGSQRVINSYIIGSISTLDFPLTPFQKGERAISYTLSGVTKEFLDQEREQIFQTTSKEIHNFASVVKACMNATCYCVLGNESNIETENYLFNRITQLGI
ncbi:MAG: insulinase family protein [Caldisericia bacterium]|nr:insulinase family protein [Caldisericia bacterium]